MKNKLSSLNEGEMLFSNRDLWKLIFPLVLETALSMAVGFIDTMMVSSVGEEAVSGVAIINTISQLFTLLFTAFATGGAVIASQYLGSRDYKEACFSANQLVVISALIALPFSIILIPGGPLLISLVYPVLDPSVRNSAIAYMYPIFIMYPFLAVSYSINALYRSMNKSNVSLSIALLVNLLNVCGNAFCIHVLDLGAFGVGLATLVAQMVGTVIQLKLISNKKEILHIDSIRRFKPDRTMIRRILRIAIPSGVENSIFQIGKLIISSVIASLGTAAITADAIMCNVTGIFNIPGAAINTAVITVIGQCCGARKIRQAEYYSRMLLRLVWVSLLCSGIITILFTPQLVSVFGLSSGFGDLARIAVYTVVIESIIVWAPSFTIPSSLRAAGDVKFTLGIAILSMWLFRVLFGSLFALLFDFGLIGVYFGVGLDWGFRAIVYEIRFRKGKWKTINVI